MKKQINHFFSILLAIAAVFAILSCSKDRPPRKGVILEQRSLILTIGASEKLNYTLTPEALPDPGLIWTSSNENVATVSSEGIVTAVNYNADGPAQFLATIAAGTAEITVQTADEKYKDTITVTTTMQALVDILDLPPMKDQFNSYFMMGNIFVPNDASPSEIVNQRLIRHYNILTPENAMKPDALAPGRSTYNFNTADRMVNAALASGFKVHGHTLLWHQQNGAWKDRVARMEKDEALVVMKRYITDIVTHFNGRIYSWDVLNEIITDGASPGHNWELSLRKENPWFAAIGPDFIYEGFLAARLADPSVILYYNDYNTDQNGKATMIRNMVQDVNARYRREYPNETRLLIEGIGMQEHHNTGVAVASIRRTIDLFRPLGVRLSVAELDIIGQSWSDFRANGGAGANRHDRANVTNNGLREQARLYGEYFKLYMDNADIIERVSLWGVVDNQSWRSRGLPLLFDPEGKAKPAYYSIISALESVQ